MLYGLLDDRARQKAAKNKVVFPEWEKQFLKRTITARMWTLNPDLDRKLSVCVREKGGEDTPVSSSVVPVTWAGPQAKSVHQGERQGQEFSRSCGG